MPMQTDVAQLSRRLDLNVDLGFSRWETTKRLRSDAEFDVFLARPRGSNLEPNFQLKATDARTSGSLVGAAAVERDRFLGALLSPRLLPTIDFVRPRLISATQAQRGCVVVPVFSGRTLQERIEACETFSSAALAAIFAQLSVALAALHQVGWVAGSFSPSQILLADAVDAALPPTVTLVDFSSARRFERPSLLADAPFENARDRFDADFRLPPDVFFAPDASPERDFAYLSRFVERLKSPSLRSVR